MANAVLEAVEAGVRGRRALLAAVSGGMDSVVLLHALVCLRDKLSLRVEAAHLEHGIRAEESEGDMRFVEELCGRWKIPLHMKRADVPRLAKESGMNLEQTARLTRYRFMEEVRKAEGLDAVVTAHHLNDQAETVLLHLIRGSGLRGLCGISAAGENLLRPLLTVSRLEIAAYCRENGLPYREDSTNRDARYARNRVRLNVLPEMEKINPGAAESIARCALILREDECYLQEQAMRLYERGKRGKGFEMDADAPKALRMRALYFYLESLGEREIDRRKLQSLDRLFSAKTGERAGVGKSLFEKTGTGVFPVEEAQPFSILAKEEGKYRLPDGAWLDIRICEKPQSISGSGKKQYFSAESLSFPILIRSRRDGDRMEPYGMEGSKLLSDAMIDQKIPRHLRNRLPLIEKDGKILFVPLVRRSRHFPVHADDEWVIAIEYMET